MGTQEKIIIEDIAYGGKGVGKLADGRICFVPFMAIGDEVVVEFVKDKKSFVEAKVVSFEKRGDKRVEPKCQHFSVCGGCDYQHLDYDEQVELKHRQLRTVLERIGQVQLPEVSITKSPKQYGYRNKLRLSPSRNDNQEVEYGLYSCDNKTIININNCPLAMPAVNSKIAVLQETVWGVRNTTLERPAKATIRKSSENEAVIYYGKISVNFPWLKEKILGKNFRVPLESFFQVNNEIGVELLKTVTGYIESLSVKTVIDAFCGSGFLTIKSTKKVVGIEKDRLAIGAANENAKTFGVDGYYMSGDVIKHLQQQIKRAKGRRCAVVLDPPRNGCSDEVLKVLLEEKPSSIIYVSCDCSTLARDVKKLSEKYDISQASLLDMFPQTSHFETVLLLTKKIADGMAK